MSTTIQLPSPRKVYPVKMPYLVRSDMYKLGKTVYGQAEQTLFMVDTDYEQTIVAVLEMLKTHPDHVRVYVASDLEGLTAALWRVAQCIADDQPQFASYEAGRFTSKLLGLSLKQDDTIQFDPQNALFPELATACYAHLKPLSVVDQLCDLLRLSVQEDIVIGKVDPEANEDLMECLLVPLPSKWSPQEKVGLSFAGTHAPIPGNERLMNAAPRLVDAIMSKGPYIRYNWSLSSEELPQDPAINTAMPETYAALNQITDYDRLMQAVYLRVERQTLTAFTDLNRYLFAIHTYMYPLADVLTSTDRKQHFLGVLQSMPADLLAHRGFVKTIIHLLERKLEDINISEHASAPSGK